MNKDQIRELFGLRNEYRGLRYDLANVRALLEALGNPQRSFRSVLVAGTNGKGAVARWLSGMLPGAGLYVSPHLVRLNERISVGGETITDAELQAVHDDVRRAEKDAWERLLYPPTYFELVTAMAFHFFRGRTRYAAVEVGLGGRLDATNVLDQDVSVITSIGLDHQEHLGPTLESIAAEKAGIIKDSDAVVIGRTCLFRPIVERAGPRLVDASSLTPRLQDLGAGFFDVEIETPRWRYRGLRPRLPGRHQIENLVVAVRAAEALAERGWPITGESISNAVNTADWPGRLETFPGTPSFVVDGGHNVQAVRALARYLAEYHPGGVGLIFGAMAEKNWAEMLRILAPHAVEIVLTRPSSERAADPARLHAVVPHARLTGDLATAVDTMRILRPEGVILVCGSLYLAGEARSILESRQAAVRP